MDHVQSPSLAVTQFGRTELISALESTYNGELSSRRGLLRPIYVVGRQNLLAVFVMFLMGSVRLRAGSSLLISYPNISLDCSQNKRSPWQVTLKTDPGFEKYISDI